MVDDPQRPLDQDELRQVRLILGWRGLDALIANRPKPGTVGELRAAIREILKTGKARP